MKNLMSIILLLIGVGFLTHCAEKAADKKDTAQLEKPELKGAWEVTKAMRDGELTKTLDNTIFLFTEDSMITNLPTQEESAQYTWAENQLIRQGDDITTYNVHTLNKDSMEFSVVLKGSSFRMRLQKVIEEDNNQ